MKRILVILFSFSILSHSILAKAELETGIGLSAVHFPHYIGSDQSHNLVLPFPYIRYRSETLNVDRNLIQSKLWSYGNWNLEMSFGGAVPVSSDDNDAREGMEDLDFILEAGPAMHYYFSGNRMSENAIVLALPLRSAISTDFSKADGRGYSFNPSLAWRRGYQYETVLVRPQINIGIRNASAQLYDYTYGVEAEFATNSRKEYKADGGYGGYFMSYSTSMRFDNYLLAVGLSYNNLKGASYEDSPLVKQKENILFGIAWATIF